MDKEPPLVTGIGLDAARGTLDAADIPLDVDTIFRLLAMIFLMGTGIAAIGGADNIDVRDGDERAVDDDDEDEEESESEEKDPQYDDAEDSGNGES